VATQSTAQIRAKEGAVEEHRQKINGYDQVRQSMVTVPINGANDCRLPPHCAWLTICHHGGRPNGTYGAIAEIGRVDASDVAWCIAQLLGGRMLTVYAHEESMVDDVLIPRVRGRCNYEIKAITDKWHQQQFFRGPVDPSPQRLLSLELPVKRDPTFGTVLPEYYACLGYAANLIHVDDESHADIVRRGILYPELRDALIFETGAGLRHYKDDHPQQRRDLIALDGTRIRANGARTGRRHADAQSETFRGVALGTPALDPRIRRTQLLEGEIAYLRRQLEMAEEKAVKAAEAVKETVAEKATYQKQCDDLNERIVQVDREINDLQEQLTLLMQKRKRALPADEQPPARRARR